ncbi:MAG: carbohydrate porin [Verrucomicrobiota bacterium]
MDKRKLRLGPLLPVFLVLVVWPATAQAHLKPQNGKKAISYQFMSRLTAAIVASCLYVFCATAETEEKPSSSAGADADADIPQSLWERETLTGDWGGVRSRLADKGLEFETTYTGEFLANVHGGARTGELYQGLLRSDLNLDIEKAGGWKGGVFHVSGLWIAGSEPNSRNDIAGMTGVMYLEPSNISAYDTVRLYELWLEQSFLEDRLSIRAGQIAVDERCHCSDYAGVFISWTHGWPAFMSALIPNGGPAYPVAGTGVMVTGRPHEQIELVAAVVDGDVEDQSTESRHGTHFGFGHGNGVLALFEAIWRCNYEKGATGLPGVFKIGAWFHSGDFDDLRFDTLGRSLEDDGTLSGLPSNGVARSHPDNGGVYFNVDQMLWREKADSDEGLGLYGRVAPWMPEDRNPVDFYVAGGVTYKGLLPTRDQDTFGVAASYVATSDGLRDRQRDANAIIALGGTPNTLGEGPVPDYEMALEITYQIVLTPWWSLQPDFQYIFHPGGSTALQDSVVLGLRTTISF